LTIGGIRAAAQTENKAATICIKDKKWTN